MILENNQKKEKYPDGGFIYIIKPPNIAEEDLHKVGKTDKSLNTLNPKLENFTKRLTSLIVGHGHHPIAFEISGITFWTDPSVINPPGPFRFERTIDIPFSENRYYSAAPLQTNVHLEMLTELESILSS